MRHAPADAADRKPNIIHIVADDLGWKDVGFNGCTDIKTPNLERWPRAARNSRSSTCNRCVRPPEPH
jgi:hypothetical protein